MNAIAVPSNCEFLLNHIYVNLYTFIVDWESILVGLIRHMAGTFAIVYYMMRRYIHGSYTSIVFWDGSFQLPLAMIDSTYINQSLSTTYFKQLEEL